MQNQKCESLTSNESYYEIKPYKWINIVILY